MTDQYKQSNFIFLNGYLFPSQKLSCKSVETDDICSLAFEQLL